MTSFMNDPFSYVANCTVRSVSPILGLHATPILKFGDVFIRHTGEFSESSSFTKKFKNENFPNVDDELNAKRNEK